jgi:hypothetical protein
MVFGGRIVGAALLLGGGALVIAAVLSAPKIMRTARPLLREGLKRGLGLYEQARTAAAELAEDVDDLVAEVRLDLDAARPASPPPAADEKSR